MKVEGDFEVVSRGDNRVTLRPTGDLKVLDGSFDLPTTETLKDNVHAVISFDLSSQAFYEYKKPYSDQELLETAIQEVWVKRGGISGNPRPKDDDAEVVKLLDELKSIRDDDNPDNDIYLSPLVRKQKKEEKEKKESEGKDTIGSTNGKVANFGGVSIDEDSQVEKDRKVKEETEKRQPLVPPSPMTTAFQDSKKALEGTK